MVMHENSGLKCDHDSCRCQPRGCGRPSARGKGRWIRAGWASGGSGRFTLRWREDDDHRFGQGHPKVVDAGPAGFSRQRMVRSRVLIRWRLLPRVVVRTTRRRTRATVRAWGCRARIVSLASASWIVRFSSRPWAFPSPVWARGSVRRAACGPCLPEGSRRARRARRSGTADKAFRDVVRDRGAAVHTGEVGLVDQVGQRLPEPRRPELARVRLDHILDVARDVGPCTGRGPAPSARGGRRGRTGRGRRSRPPERAGTPGCQISAFRKGHESGTIVS